MAEELLELGYTNGIALGAVPPGKIARASFLAVKAIESPRMIFAEIGEKTPPEVEPLVRQSEQEGREDRILLARLLTRPAMALVLRGFELGKKRKNILDRAKEFVKKTPIGVSAKLITQGAKAIGKFIKKNRKIIVPVAIAGAAVAAAVFIPSALPTVGAFLAKAGPAVAGPVLGILKGLRKQKPEAGAAFDALAGLVGPDSLAAADEALSEVEAMISAEGPDAFLGGLLKSIGQFRALANVTTGAGAELAPDERAALDVISGIADKLPADVKSKIDADGENDVLEQSAVAGVQAPVSASLKIAKEEEVKFPIGLVIGIGAAAVAGIGLFLALRK
jgi:hypothetical protein